MTFGVFFTSWYYSSKTLFARMSGHRVGVNVPRQPQISVCGRVGRTLVSCCCINKLSPAPPPVFFKLLLSAWDETVWPNSVECLYSCSRRVLSKNRLHWLIPGTMSTLPGRSCCWRAGMTFLCVCDSASLHLLLSLFCSSFLPAGQAASRQEAQVKQQDWHSRFIIQTEIWKAEWINTCGFF